MAAHDGFSTRHAVVTPVRYVARVSWVPTACRVSAFMNYRIVKRAAPVVLRFLVLRVTAGYLGPFATASAAVLREGTGLNHYIVGSVARITGFTCKYRRHFLRPSGFSVRSVDVTLDDVAVRHVRQVAEATL